MSRAKILPKAWQFYTGVIGEIGDIQKVCLKEEFGLVIVFVPVLFSASGEGPKSLQSKNIWNSPIEYFLVNSILN